MLMVGEGGEGEWCLLGLSRAISTMIGDSSIQVHAEHKAELPESSKLSNLVINEFLVKCSHDYKITNTAVSSGINTLTNQILH